jgi:hypothetical protein
MNELGVGGVNATELGVSVQLNLGIEGGSVCVSLLSARVHTVCVAPAITTP